MPKISIIVPVYNVEKYLGFCLDSILNQTFSDFILILVDDGSTDKSGEICDSYAEKDGRVRVFHTENHGSAMARNIGLDKVQTEYVAMIDSDDYVPPCYIGHLFNIAIENDADIVYCLGKRFREDSQVLFDADFDLCRDKTEVYDQKQIINILCTRYTTNLIVPMKLYKTSVFSGARYPAVKKNDDEWIIHKLFLNSKKVAFSPAKLYHWRERQGNQTLTFSTDNFSGVLALIDRKKVLKKHGYKIPVVFYERFMRLATDYYYRCLKNELDPIPQLKTVRCHLIFAYIKIVLISAKRKLRKQKVGYDRNDLYTLFMFSFVTNKYPVDWDRLSNM